MARSEPYVKYPAVPVPRSPGGDYQSPPARLSKTGHWYLTHVIDEDSWLSLANLDGWSNPWDLIEANFQTRDPDVVNWYLKEYVGCKAMTADHNNYRFSTAASPGVIYTQTRINRTGAPDYQALYGLVMSALDHAAINYVWFKLKGYYVSPSMLRDAKAAIAKGRIQLEHRPTLDTDGKYYIEYNKLSIKSLARSAENRAMVVHESVHAAMDWSCIGVNHVNRAISEALAYVAQGIYHHHNSGHWLSGDPDEAGIFSALETIVIDAVDWQFHRMELRKGLDVYTVPDAAANDLLDAIHASKLYRGARTQTTVYNGVER